MATHKLDNYLRTYRKRAGLSQTEMAYLLGTRAGAKSCRHESFARVPSLETALAYEAIFRAPVAELFAGMYERAERAAARRARLMKKRLGRGRNCSDRKLRLLAEIAPEKRSKNNFRGA
jgi:DNA-binding XRE family transcriptional regulator